MENSAKVSIPPPSGTTSKHVTPTVSIPPIPSFLSLFYWMSVFLLILLASLTVDNIHTICQLHTTLPVPNRPNTELQHFSEANARSYLRHVTLQGPRPCGSDLNEIHTPKYLKEVFKRLERFTMSSERHPYKVEIQEQLAKQGSFALKFLHLNQMTSVYRNVRNLLVRVQDTRSSEKNVTTSRNAVLINCHYDSVVDSPGASDDFVNCAIMMEILRALIHRRTPLQHDLIFLFNGAEENILQASHAFITQHPWRHHVAAFVNMESAGMAGRFLLFQAGPDAPWLVEEYAAAVSSPFASVMAMEVFQSGLIPSDTDFRIFRDYSPHPMPGLDLAFVENGYIYHTKYDQERRISPACLHLAGTSMLALVERLAQSVYVSRPDLYEGGDRVFFDVFGLFVVTYSSQTEHLINLLLTVLVLADVVRACSRHDVGGKDAMLRGLSRAVLSNLLSLALFAVGLTVLAWGVGAVGKYLMWYAQPYHILGLYGLPLSWLFLTYHAIIADKLFSWPRDWPAQMEEAHILAPQCLLSTLIVTISLAKSHSSYLFSLWLAAVLLANFTWRWLQWIWRGFPSWWLEVLFLINRIIFLGAPLLYHVYNAWLLFEVFVPIMGRVLNAKINPEVFIVVLVWLVSSVVLLVLSADVKRTSPFAVKMMRYLMFHLFLSYAACLMFTNQGFPYNSSSKTPRKQRVALVHVNRVVRGTLQEGGMVQTYDSGIWMSPQDANGIAFLKPLAPNMKPVPCEPDLPYCGFPSPILTKSYIIAKEPHNATPVPKLSLVSLVSLSPHLVNLTLALDGPACNLIFVQTPEGIILRAWSFILGAPEPVTSPHPDMRGTHYFVYNAYGSGPPQPLRWWMVLDVANGLQQVAGNTSTIRVALSAQYRCGDQKNSESLERTVHYMPDWVVASSWSATYESWAVDVHQGLKYVQ